MNKYFYYNYFIVAFANLLVFVPYVIIQHRYNGAAIAIGLGFIIGTILLYLFIRASQKFPGKDIMDIVEETKQRWFFLIFIPLKTLVSITSSLLVVGGYAIIVSRYLNPDGNLGAVIALVLIAVGYAATRNLLSVAYILEFMVVVAIPLILFIVFKTLMNPLFTFDSVRAVANHYSHMPNLLTVAAAAFMFSGFGNLSLFIEKKDRPLKFRYCWPAPILMLLLLISTILIPIGILGSETAAEYYFVWTVASDATQMPFGFIERLMFLFIIVLLIIAVTYTVIVLNQVINICKRTIMSMRKNNSKEQSKYMAYYIYGILGLTILILVIKTNDFQLEQLAMWYLVVSFITEVCFTLIFYIIVMVKGNKTNETKHT